MVPENGLGQFWGSGDTLAWVWGPEIGQRQFWGPGETLGVFWDTKRGLGQFWRCFDVVLWS